jgi:hypothetical protein
MLAFLFYRTLARLLASTCFEFFFTTLFYPIFIAPDPKSLFRRTLISKYFTLIFLILMI